MSLRVKNNTLSSDEEKNKEDAGQTLKLMDACRKSPLRRTQSMLTRKEAETAPTTTKKDVVQIAIWGDADGVGGKGRMFASLNRMHNVSVLGFCKHPSDVGSRQNLAQNTDAVDISEYRNEQVMLQDSRIDAIVVATSTSERSRCIRKAVSAGKHVFVTDTPLACTVEQFKELCTALETATKKRLVVSAMQSHRLDASFKALKFHIVHETMHFGIPFSIQHDFSQTKPPENWKTERPLLIDEGARVIDTTHFLLGLPMAQLNFVTNNSRDRFQAFVESRYERKEISTHIVGSRALRANVAHESITVRFSRGTITLDTGRQTLSVFNHETESTVITSARQSKKSDIWRQAALNFVEAVFGSETPYVTHNELLQSTRFALIVELNKDKLV